MPRSRHGVDPRLATGLVCLALLLLLPAVLPAPAEAADITLSSRTYLLYFEREFAGGNDRKFAPLYEYLSGDASDLGGRPLSFHFYGWGRIDLGDDTDDDGRGGDLASAYLRYLHPTGNGEVRLGRFFLVEGTAAEILDGVFLKGRTPAGLGLSVYGGVPVERSITATETGDSIYGGRLFFARAGFAEIGATYLKESGEFRGDDREMVGGDLWVSPGIPVEVSGRASYNLSTSAIATQRYVLRAMPFARLDLAVGYEQYRYKDLFQTALHSAFLSPAIDNTDEVQVLFASFDLTITDALSLELGGKSIRHDRSDPGDAVRAEAGIRYLFNDWKDVAGLSAAVVSADRDENEYQEFRVFASYSPGRFRFALDALTHRYEQAVGGSSIKDAYHVVGSAGFQVLPYLKVSGDLTYNRSPRFTEDYAGLVRVSVDFGTTLEGWGARDGNGDEAPTAVEQAPGPAPEKERAPVIYMPDRPRPSPESSVTGVDRQAGPVLPAPPVPTAGPPKATAVAPEPAAVPPKPAAEPPKTAAVPPGTAAVDPVVSSLERMEAQIRTRIPTASVARRGETLELTMRSDLAFEVGSARLSPSALRSLAAAAQILKENPGTLVTIEGHTDSSGRADRNQDLSERRARSVYDVLVKNGVPASRLTARGYGEKVPAADNATAEGRRANRRVQMKIRPDGGLKGRQGQGG